jgi:hypothetical protein
MKTDRRRRYYVYVWKINDTGEVIYVGKGTGKRYLTRKRENKYFMNMVKSHDCSPEIIYDNLTEREAFDKEIETIALYRLLCHRLTNVQDGGEQPPKHDGMKRSAETRERISEGIKRAYSNSPELHRKSSERMKAFLATEEGKAFSQKSIAARNNPEFRRKLSIKCRAANNTPEYLERQSACVKAMWNDDAYKEAHSGAKNIKAQAVRQLSLDGEFIAEFDTITEASKVTGAQLSKISAVCKGRRKTAGGFKWEFVNDKHITFKNRPSAYNPDKDKCAKPILQYSRSGEFIAEHRSIADAVRANPEMSRGSIIANLKGRTKHAYGFVWKYKHGNPVPSLSNEEGVTTIPEGSRIGA